MVYGCKIIKKREKNKHLYKKDPNSWPTTYPNSEPKTIKIHNNHGKEIVLEINKLDEAVQTLLHHIDTLSEECECKQKEIINVKLLKNATEIKTMLGKKGTPSGLVPTTGLRKASTLSTKLIGIRNKLTEYNHHRTLWKLAAEIPKRQEELNVCSLFML